MGNVDWHEVETIVDKVLELPEEKWFEYVENRCEASQEVKSEVTRLLHSITDSEGWLEDAESYKRGVIGTASGQSAPASLIGTEVGSYRIREIIARGGMGAVYRGERADGEFNHTVAIKVIKVGMDTPENIRLFNRERNILAGLNHPGIAKLFDGGVLENGAPYLIMEYVEGTPIDQYCDEHKLSVDERIGLFKKVLKAVRYAHQNLVIHRDLKPDNIFITEQEEVKILDFGIAKLLDTEEEAGDTIHVTQTRILTPKYAAPEQIRQHPATTATDLYSLGIILHQLLTGCHPFDLHNKSVYEAGSIILNDEPRLPSNKLKQHTDAKKLAAKRSANTDTLASRLRGDLDAILLKAIEKDPDRRYPTSNALIGELENYQAALPISARTNTLGYRVAKFYKRNRSRIAVGAGILLLIVSFMAFYAWRITEERNQARLEAQKAEQITNFMVGLFDSNRPDQAQGDTLTALDLLQNGMDRIETMEQQPEVQTSMLRVIGDVYRSVSRHTEAEKLLKDALERQRELYNPTHLEIGKTTENLAQLKYTTGDFEASDSLFRVANSIYEQAYDPPHETIARGISNHAELLEEIGKLDEAEQKHNRALNMFRQLYGDKHIQIAFVLNDLAIVYDKQGKFDRSAEYYQKALDLLYETGNERHPRVASGMHNLALVYQKKGDNEAALELMENALELRKDLFGDNHHLVASSMNGMAVIQRELEDYRQAEMFLREALEILRSNFGDNHLHVNYNLSNLGNVLMSQGKYQEADSLFRVALSNFSELLGDDHRVCGFVNNYLGEVSLKQEKFKESLVHYGNALSILENTISSDHPRLGDTMFGLGRNHLNMNNVEEAEKKLERALNIFKKSRGDEHQKTIEAYIALGSSLLAQKKYAQSENFFLEGLEALSNKMGMENTETQSTLEKLVDLYEKWEKPEEKEKYQNMLVTN